VQQGDAPPLLRSAGAARLEPTAQPAGPQTRYRIGSISKTMTAVMVLQLAEEGRLALDAPVARWFPTLPDAGRMTVAHLLAHRGGLGRIEATPAFDEQWVFEPRGEADLLAAIAAQPRRFEPGSAAEYSNAGYLLLSFIVEKAGGKPYAQALAERIARPLGLVHTRFDPKVRVQPDEARSYHWDSGRWVAARAAEPSVPQGAGGVVSTPRDLVVFMRALFKGRLLPPAALQRMQTVQDGFGLGLNPYRGPGGTAWGHYGAIDAFGSFAAYLPEHDTAVAWCGNAHQLLRDAVVQTLRRAVFEPTATLPSYAPRPVTVDFELDLAQPPNHARPATVGLRGNAAPLTWQHNLPLVHDAASGSWKARVTLTLRDGLPLEYKYLRGDDGWERTGNRELHAAGSAPVVVQDVFNHDAERLALRREILAADHALFDAFNRGEMGPIERAFSERLEFFHDRTGLTDYAHNMRQLRSTLAQPTRPRRERVGGEQEVFALGGFGALHVGAHRFCRRERASAPERCETYRFSHVWEKGAAGWQLLRVISFDH
jgi:CubicO group peptidase (beta-lactamase class C family)